MGEQAEATATKKPRVALWIATGFGLGYLPVAPGTWGSLGGVAIGWILGNLWVFVAMLISFIAKAYEGIGVPLPFGMSIATAIRLPYVVGTVFFCISGVWASRIAADHFRKSDPGQVVVDEIAGQMITYLPVFVPAFIERGGWKYLLLGFVLFRVFDIVKPWPAWAAEKWPGGWGIMADDWFAGGYAAIVLWLVRWAGWLG